MGMWKHGRENIVAETLHYFFAMVGEIDQVH